MTDCTFKHQKKLNTSCHLTVFGFISDLLLQVVGGGVVWLRPLSRGWRLQFAAAAVAAAAETAAAVKAGEDPTEHEQTLNTNTSSAHATSHHLYSQSWSGSSAPTLAHQVDSMK